MKKDPTEFRQRFAAWKNGEQVYDKGRPMQHYGGGKEANKSAHSIITEKPGTETWTDQCATWSNSLLRNAGYLIYGDAWNLKNVNPIFNGYTNIVRPKKFDRAAIEQRGHQATDSVYKNFDSKTLDKTKPYVVNMYVNGSPALQKAFNANGDVDGTHTGLLTHDGQKWVVTHNMHKKIFQEPFIQLQNSKGQYGVTAIYEPREDNLYNRVRGFFGFEEGKERYPNTTSGAYIPSIITKQPTPLPKNHPLEIAGQFLPYVGTIADIKDLVGGDLSKFSSVVTGTIADLFLPEIRTSAKAYKTAIKTLEHAPTPLRPVVYQTVKKASRKLANSIGIQIGDAINTGMQTYDSIR